MKKLTLFINERINNFNINEIKHLFNFNEKNLKKALIGDVDKLIELCDNNGASIYHKSNELVKIMDKLPKDVILINGKYFVLIADTRIGAVDISQYAIDFNEFE